jgi:ankyrin repeat protein
MRTLIGSSLLMGLGAVAWAQRPPSLFQPHATVDLDPVCASVVQHARVAFRSDDPSVISAMPLTQVGALTRLDSIEPVPVPPFEGSHGRGALRYDLSTPGRPLFLIKVNVPGCGGACETVQAFVSSSPDARGHASTDILSDWDVYHRGDARYLLGYDEDQLTLYRLTDDPMSRVCDVRLSALRTRSMDRPEARAVAGVVDEYAEAVRHIQGGAGWCGTMNSPGRLRSRLADSIEMLFYRPWALTRGGDEERVELRAWSLQGIAEFEAYGSMERAFATARDALARLYASDYQLTAAEARKLAGAALRGAASSGFLFPSAAPFDDGADAIPELASDDYPSPFVTGVPAQLRRALLERRPMAEISRLEVSASDLDGAGDGESILNVAVRYPEALAWLLARGANPNTANAFGKTPLMYAAQLDEPRSVELLLEGGAYANATTTRPRDNCYYTIARERVSALHYAARHARPAVAARLLAAGALTFVAASDAPVYALDVLREHGDAGRRTPLTPAERASLEAALQPSDEPNRARFAAELAAKGNALYRAGKFQAAYQATRDSQLAMPPSHAARSDFALIALRAGHVMESLAASHEVISKADDAGLRAGAWFNLGLACQQSDRREPGRHEHYGRFEFCRQHEMLTFLKAWSEAPSPARERKVTAMLEALVPHCTVAQADGSREQYFVLWSNLETRKPDAALQRVLVRHAHGAAPPADAVRYEITRHDGSREERRTALESRYDFGDFSLSVLRGVGHIQGNVLVRGQPCHVSS